MGKLSNFLPFCFALLLSSGFSTINSKKNIYNSSTDKSVNTVSKKQTEDNINNGVQKTKQNSTSSLSKEILDEIEKSCKYILKYFFSSIVNLKEQFKTENDKKIIKFLEDCKFTFENNNGLIVNIYPKNVCGKDYTLENIVTLDINSNNVKFNLAKGNLSSEKKKSFDVSLLSKKEIKRIFHPHREYIKEILANILSFKNIFSDYEYIVNFLSSCKFSFEKYNSSKEQIFKFNIYPDGFLKDKDANIIKILDIDLDKNSSVIFNLVRKQKVNKDA